MAINQYWAIEGYTIRENFNGYTNVVSSIQWSLTTEYESGRSVINGYAMLGAPQGQFIAESDLTEQLLMQWLKDSIGSEQVKRYENDGVQQAAGLVNPVVDWKRPSWMPPLPPPGEANPTGDPVPL